MAKLPASDTIAAISTPPGQGGIGMVRLTGPRATSIAGNIFTPLGGWKTFPPEARRAVVGHAHSSGQPENPIDMAVCTFFPRPRSYTGEDIVELTAHGGPFIMRTLLEAAVGAGARLADPGEFTRRAFLNGRMDLSQAEAVALLVHASTDSARKAMLNQVTGAMGRAAHSLKRDLMEAKVVLESAIDFPEEEDIGDLNLGQVERILNKGARKADALMATGKEGVALGAGLSVVIAGTPNVGKSSLLNALLEEERAIVHKLAGTTRDSIEGNINVQGVPVRIIDTAGIRQAADEIEVEGVLRTRKQIEKADLIIVVIDSARELDPGDLSLLKETELSTRVVVANKTDLPPACIDLPEDALKVSAKTGEGIEGLKRAVYNRCFEEGALDRTEGAVVVSVRQAEALKGVHDACLRACQGMKNHVEPECLAVDVDEALMYIGHLTGEITSEDVLEKIFENFCIGK
ncbi:tRNA uridine-5-carboxymethylaminomethyl(34) synthesis GTPase MnmE [bacterium]|nr:MAG: tRNA uridine-5-carboxymethylaminomethyl(34) synthesis GTPase MnmE [bacterium]